MMSGSSTTDDESEAVAATARMLGREGRVNTTTAAGLHPSFFQRAAALTVQSTL